MSVSAQPFCDRCWDQYTRQNGQPGRFPVRMKDPPAERCCICDDLVWSGIYVRIDAESVPYPKKERAPR